MVGRHIVTQETFIKCISDINNHTYERKALDTETTGLQAFKDDELFSIIISTKTDDYYFNFSDNNTVPEVNVLPRKWLSKFKELFSNTKNAWYIHNAKFDLHFLAKEGLYIAGLVYCTQALAKLVQNALPSYSLENLGSIIGYEKDDAVKAYISKYKLFTDVDVGKKRPKRLLHFDRVPFHIIAPYGLTDGRVCFELGEYIFSRLTALGLDQHGLELPPLNNVIKNEVALTNALFHLEQTGIKIDREYCKEAYAYEIDQVNEAKEKFYVMTGLEFEDGPKRLKEAYALKGLEPGYTPKGNASFSDVNLPDDGLADIIRQYRKHYKRATTYYRNFLDLAGDDDIIHANFRQDGTITGRMSASSPNLQNVPKRGEDNAAYPVRKAFIPRPGYFFAMLDWDQMEYRMLLDVADEAELIKQILEDDLDVHTATALAMNVERDPAKTLNFMLLYGGGAKKLSEALKCTLAKAKNYKSLYFRSLKMVKFCVENIVNTSKSRGYVVNWLGRRLTCDKEASYKMPNHYIQGGCGDVCKKAMVKTHELLLGYKSRMLLQVHDELIIEVKYGEEEVIEKIKYIMENTYPHNRLPLTAGVDFSKTDWHNKGVYSG